MKGSLHSLPFYVSLSFSFLFTHWTFSFILAFASLTCSHTLFFTSPLSMPQQEAATCFSGYHSDWENSPAAAGTIGQTLRDTSANSLSGSLYFSFSPSPLCPSSFPDIFNREKKAFISLNNSVWTSCSRRARDTIVWESKYRAKRAIILSGDGERWVQPVHWTYLYCWLWSVWSQTLTVSNIFNS